MAFHGKPILGIVGGIASGKSFVARLLSSLGAFVIDSDSIAHEVYRDPRVIRTMQDWYGPSVINEQGDVDRRAIGSRVFRDPVERRRLEALLHPLINQRREEMMASRVNDDAVRLFVWDSPLLIEAGLDRDCDAILFIDTPIETRLARATASRGWDAAELHRRESNQVSLEMKRQRSRFVVRGDVEVDVLKRNLSKMVETLTSTKT